MPKTKAPIEDRIEAWSIDDKPGYWEVIELVTEAMDELKRLRQRTVPAVAPIVKLLRYSLEPIGFDYDKLTSHERELLSREEFGELVGWLRKQEVK